ncbi:hypothetical protein CFK41_02865 [Brachybacterium ginsengisoli]|uniref:DUF6318 domain-containing protein n=1 Tax=Brachybacterium ginsengisoli TaxID=1331682 RepID=A0A291GUI5_9MICO|nr:hypothetical protein CFK41_02865 [Brachybacterium ginsengisoli]
MDRVNRPVQRIVVIVLALLLVVPAGVFGIGQLLGPGDGDQPGTTAAENPENPENRPTADPADQPPRPDLPEPEAPAGLTDQSEDGARATVTYLLQTYDYMMSSGDVSVWQDSVDPGCQVCVSFLDNAELLSDQGGYLVDGAFEVHSTTFSGKGEPPATGTVVAQFTQEESVLVDDPNLQATPLDSVTGQLIATVAWDGDRWRVTDMTIAPPEGQASDGGGASDSGGAAG